MLLISKREGCIISLIMLSELLFVCFLFMAASTNAASIDMSQYSKVYNYFVTDNKSDLKSEVKNTDIHPLTVPEVVKLKFKIDGLSFICCNYTCSSNGTIAADKSNPTNRVGLSASFTYVPEKDFVHVVVKIDDIDRILARFPATNPPEICVAYPFQDLLNICFSNVYPVGKNLHTCIDFEAYQSIGWALVVKDLNCVTFGADGVHWSKREDNNTVPEYVKP